MSEGFMISGAENIAKFQLLRVYHALKLQAKFGLKCKGGSLLKYAKHHYGAHDKLYNILVFERDNFAAKMVPSEENLND